MTKTVESLSENNRSQLQNRGMSTEQFQEQVSILSRRTSFSKLVRPATLGDGIVSFDEKRVQELSEKYETALRYLKTVKFVPASGAATRMFQPLQTDPLDPKTIDALRSGLSRFAFFDELGGKMTEAGLSIEDCIENNKWREIINFMLYQKGLNYSETPKGLIKFHSYGDHARTPFEEHLEEAMHYVLDSEGNAEIYFTVSEEHKKKISEHLNERIEDFEQKGIKIHVSLLTQKRHTDTIAVDLENCPVKNEEGDLLFRPGGHGALLENLGELDCDIVFIKNIDNVVPDRLKETTYTYKKAIGGLLVELQDLIFEGLNTLSAPSLTDVGIKEVSKFCNERLSLEIPKEFHALSLEEKGGFLKNLLNRPLRVCGVVRNDGEPGGGPFWVMGRDGKTSLQIVESAEVNLDDEEQNRAWNAATHFNPVDLVCGLKNFVGNKFDLAEFRDNTRWFITKKSHQGRNIKALEHPGLWNGSMAFWNTVFVEVPQITFNPAKTLFDLARPEHQ